MRNKLPKQKFPIKLSGQGDNMVKKLITSGYAMLKNHFFNQGKKHPQTPNSSHKVADKQKTQGKKLFGKKDKLLNLFSLKLIHFSVFTSIYLLHPAHAGHTAKLLPQGQLKKIQRNYNHEISERFNAWDHLLINSRDKSIEEKLHLVNDFFNQMKWVNDNELWNERDYWATPIESLIRNAGDCEDFSIAKYFTLLELGVPIQQLKISYVKIVGLDQSHMVLAYYATPESDPLILDNLNKTILKSSQRTDLLPMFNFNGEGVWTEDNPYTPLDSVTKIRHWADMIKRMGDEQS